jgi:hypothetical protein
MFIVKVHKLILIRYTAFNYMIRREVKSIQKISLPGLTAFSGMNKLAKQGGDYNRCGDWYG